MTDGTGAAPTSPIYWGIGGLMLSYGLLKEPPGTIAVGVGVLLLVVKLIELCSGESEPLITQTRQEATHRRSVVLSDR